MASTIGRLRHLALAGGLVWPVSTGVALDQADVNYDEARVPAYVLPDALTLAGGQPVKDAATWRARRRPELLRLFEENVYGRSPGRPAGLRFESAAVDPKALGGRATRKQVRILLDGRKDGPSLELLLYLPNGRTRPSPRLRGSQLRGQPHGGQGPRDTPVHPVDRQERRRAGQPRHRGGTRPRRGELADRHHPRAWVRRRHRLLRRPRARSPRGLEGGSALEARPRDQGGFRTRRLGGHRSVGLRAAADPRLPGDGP